MSIKKTIAITLLAGGLAGAGAIYAWAESENHNSSRSNFPPIALPGGGSATVSWSIRLRTDAKRRLTKRDMAHIWRVVSRAAARDIAR